MSKLGFFHPFEHEIHGVWKWLKGFLAPNETRLPVEKQEDTAESLAAEVVDIILREANRN